MIVVNWLPPRKVEPVSQTDSTIAMLMIGRSYLANVSFINTAIVLSMWLTGSTFLGGSQLTTSIH
jgi:hypothetical protein